MRGFLAAALALSALEVFVSSDAAAGRLGGAFKGLAAVLRHLADPAVTLVPDLRPTPVYSGKGRSVAN